MKIALIVIAVVLICVGWLMPMLGLKAGDNPVTQAPADVGVSFKSIQIDSDGLTLEGWWIEADQPHSVIIWLNGAGSSRISEFFDTLGFYKTASEQGYSVLTFDQRNAGNSEYSDGYMRLGAVEWRDAMAAREWVRQEQPSDLPVILIGLSMGGATAVYALENGLEANGLVLFDPLLNTPDSLRLGGWVGYGLPPWFFQPMAWFATRFWSLRYGDDDALAVVKSLATPSLLLQNKNDPITRSKWSEEAAEANERINIAFVPDIDPSSPCLADKGRWGTHAAAYHCHPTWTMEQLDAFRASITADPGPLAQGQSLDSP